MSAVHNINTNFGGNNRGLELGNNHGPITINNHLSHEQPTNAQPVNNPYHLTPLLPGVPIVDKFVGRVSELQKLKETLLPGQQSGRKLAVVHGLGGIGKTQLSVHFVREYQHEFSTIFWLNGRDVNTLKRSFAAVAVHIPTDQIPEAARTQDLLDAKNLDLAVRTVTTWLSRAGNTSWMLVFDNVDQDHRDAQASSTAYDVRKYFPPAFCGSILITTRLVSLADLGSPLKIGEVNREEALAILKGQSNIDVEASGSGDEIIRILAGLPLGLAQASAYIRETSCSPADYIRVHREGLDKFKREIAKKSVISYDNGNLWTTWSISLAQIQKRNGNAAKLLFLWSFFDNRDFGFEILSRAYERLLLSGNKLQSCDAWFTSIAQDKSKFNDTIALLLRYSLVNGTLSGLYSVHTMVHEWAWQLQRDGEKWDSYRLALTIVGFAVPNSYESNYWAKQRQVFPHADRANIRAATFANLGRVLQFGPRWSEVILDARRKTGDLYAGQQKQATAERIYRQTLNIQLRLFSANNDDALRTMDSLVRLYLDEQRTDDAENLYFRVIHVLKDMLHVRHKTPSKYADTVFIDTNQQINRFALYAPNLGRLYIQQERFDHAERLYDDLLNLFGKTGWRAYPSPAIETSENLGIIYLSQGKLDKAEGALTRALQMKEIYYGKEHLLTLDTVVILGRLYQVQRKPARAKEMLFHAQRGFERAQDVSRSISVYCHLGSLYEDEGDDFKAQLMYSWAVDEYGPTSKSKKPQSHWASIIYYEQFAWLNVKLSNFGKAFDLWRTVLDLYDVTNQANSVRLSRFCYKMGDAYEEKLRYSLAMDTYLHAIKCRKDPSTTAFLRHALYFVGGLYLGREKYVEAETMFKNMKAGLEALRDSIDAAQAYAGLANIYSDQGDNVKTKTMFLRALDQAKKAGEEYLEWLSHVSYLTAQLCKGDGEIDQARNLYLRALSGFQQVYGESHQIIKDTREQLASIPEASVPQRYIRAEASSSRSNSLRHRLMQSKPLPELLTCDIAPGDIDSDVHTEKGDAQQCLNSWLEKTKPPSPSNRPEENNTFCTLSEELSKKYCPQPKHWPYPSDAKLSLIRNRAIYMGWVTIDDTL